MTVLFRRLAAGWTGSRLAVHLGMRLVVGLFAMFLTASVARADEAKAPDPKPEVTRTKVPLRVVRVLPESHQALLFDKNKGTHVLADVGGTIDGYTVEEIDEDEVTLSSNGREIVLAAPAERSWNRGNRNRPVAEAEQVRTAKKPTAVKADGPVDPYAELAAPADAPQDPYAEPAIVPGDEGVRVTSAAPTTFLPDNTPPSVKAMGMAETTDPQNPYADPAMPGDPYAPAPAPKKTAKPAKPAPALDGFLPPGTSATDATTFVVEPAPKRIAPAPAAPAPSIVPAIEDTAPDAAPAPPPVPAGPVITPTVLSRSDLNAQIADFNRLTSVIRGTFTPDGARLDLVADGSVFARAGLRRGDIITAVDNQPLRSIDDAAELYVRAPQTRAANIQLIRAGKPLTLRVLFQ
jgi:type II secretory pathway component PulC